jgi:hypothetical protein
MKGGVSLERIVVGEAVMVVIWYAKEQILWEIMGHHKQIASQPKWKLARPYHQPICHPRIIRKNKIRSLDWITPCRPKVDFVIRVCVCHRFEVLSPLSSLRFT